MDLELTDKTAIVTGSSRGIGKSIARQLAHEGVDVAICSRGEEALQATAEELAKETGRRILPVQADMHALDDIRRLVQQTAEAFGHIDILVNCAARLSPTAPSPTGYEQERLSTISDETIIDGFETKMLGYFRCSREVAPYMERQGWGRIIHLGGLTGRYPLGVSAGMRNAAVSNMTKALSDQLGPSGITVNAVHPAFVWNEVAQARIKAMAQREGITVEEATRFTAQESVIQRIVDATEVADVVAFLCSPKAASVTGENISTGGGYGGAVYF